MKNLGLVLILLMILSSCQKQDKIGFVDNGKLINEYQEKIVVEEKYKVKEEAFNRRTDSIGQAFQLEAQGFQLKSKNMSTANAQEKYVELGQKQQLLQQQIQFEDQQLKQAFSAEIDSVIINVKSFVKAYSEKNGYTYILGTSDVSSTVMYGTEANDLTDIIIELINIDFKNN